MRLIPLSAVALLATTGIASADPRALAPRELDQITAGTAVVQNASRAEIVRSGTRHENGRKVIRTLVEEHLDAGGKKKVRRAAILNGEFAGGDRSLYLDYIRDQNRMKRMLRDVFSGLHSDHGLRLKFPGVDLRID